MCLGLSLRLNLVFLGLMTVLPCAIALTGWPRDFPQAVYLVLVWPAASIMALTSAAFASSYDRRYRLERALEQASNTDPLTSVSNRRHFQVLLHREIVRCQRSSHPCALLMLDIDHFKRINDGHGHPTGDRAIRALADACVASSRASDVVARLGGEEFAILLPETGLQDAARLAERIREQVAQIAISSDSGEQVSWTVSVGVAGARPTDAEAPEDVGERLISQADAALYGAKSGGRNRVEIFAEDRQLSDTGAPA